MTIIEILLNLHYTIIIHVRKIVFGFVALFVFTFFVLIVTEKHFDL